MEVPQSELFREYTKSMRMISWPGGRMTRQTLEEFLAQHDDSVRPQRFAKDVSPLVEILNSGEINFSGELLREKLGEDYSDKYHSRDWMVAMEAVLAGSNPDKPARFAMDYRIFFNADGDGGIVVQIMNRDLSLPAQKRNPTPDLA